MSSPKYNHGDKLTIKASKRSGEVTGIRRFGPNGVLQYMIAGRIGPKPFSYWVEEEGLEPTADPQQPGGADTQNNSTRSGKEKKDV